MAKREAAAPQNPLDWFTDREDQQQAVADHLNAASGAVLPLLVFYGVGGVGKSLLGDRIRQMARRESEAFFRTSKALPCIRLDFDARLPESALWQRDPAEVYAAIRRLFDVPCPRFDLAFSVLRHKSGVAPAPTHRYLGNAQLAYDGTLTGLELVLSGIPFASFAAKKVIERASPALKQTKAYAYWSDKADPDLAVLLDQEPQAIRENLAARLGADLDENLPEREGDHGCRGIVILDTWEAVTDGDRCRQSDLSPQHWLEALYDSVDSVLFVVLGRNRLPWDERNPQRWTKTYLDQHYVGGLSREDADKFLSRAGVAEKSVRSIVLGQCANVERDGAEPGYYPLRLALSADIVRRLRADRRPLTAGTIQLGSGEIADLTDRFLRLLPADEARWIESLCVALRFDRDAAERAYSPTPGQKSAALWEKLTDLSFVIEDRAEAGWWFLHAQVRDVLQQKMKADPARLTEEHARLHGIYSARAQTATDTNAFLAWYHRWHLEPEAALREWDALAEDARKAQGGTGYDMALHQSLLAWWAPLSLQTHQSPTHIEGSALNIQGIEWRYVSLGDRGSNLVQAIACDKAALRVFTEEQFPTEWATTQNNLGNSYAHRPSDDRAANLAQAIECIEMALRVYTEQRFPVQWAGTQNNLGNAYADIPSGDRAANLAQAIACYKAALRVRTQERFPVQWARTQNNLGTVYRILPSGNRVANLIQSIECFDMALRVYTEEQFPMEWATTQNNLGNAYANLPSGESAVNLVQAIAFYEAALRVYTQERFPIDWANTHRNLGNVYSELPSGDRAANFAQAIAYYQAALLVYTQERFPMEWALGQWGWGNAEGARGNFELGMAKLRMARATLESIGHEHYVRWIDSIIAQQEAKQEQAESKSEVA